MTTHTNPASPHITKSNRRRRGFIALGTALGIGGASFGAYWTMYVSHFVSTDNAYASVEIAQVTTSVSGTVGQVNVVDTQKVKKGDLLVSIDDTDARLALAQAEAEYGRAVRKVRGLVATDVGLDAQIAARDADKNHAAAQLVSAQSD